MPALAANTWNEYNFLHLFYKTQGLLTKHEKAVMMNTNPQAGLNLNFWSCSWVASWNRFQFVFLNTRQRQLMKAVCLCWREETKPLILRVTVRVRAALINRATTFQKSPQNHLWSRRRSLEQSGWIKHETCIIWNFYVHVQQTHNQ